EKDQQLEARNQQLECVIDERIEQVVSLEKKLKDADSNYNFALKMQAELRAEIDSLHCVFNAMGFDDHVGSDGFTGQPRIITRFAIYQNRLLVKSMKPKKVKK
ncbi:MAG: hypothetical protein GY774_17950, partial [Planctomycetes bacterium]|nr:hypothetical protein [Planctomycetota bacterium]